MEVRFDENAVRDDEIERVVTEFCGKISTLEAKHEVPIVVFQDGAGGAYYIKCSLLASEAAKLCDLNAKLAANDPESLRANKWRKMRLVAESSTI